MGLALASFQSFAQQPGGGGRGGRGGGGPGGGGPGGWGGGPGGWGGGPGGPGGDILNLLGNAAVQEEIKLKEAQKVKISTLTEQSKQQRQKIQTLMNEARQNAQNQNGGNQGGNNQQQGGGRGGRGGRGRQMDPETQELFAMMREQMGEVQNYVDTSITKILDKNQLARVKQIQLQLDSPQNLFREDMIDKLQISEEQQAMMTEVRDENRTLQRESGQGRRELMKAAMDSIPQVQANNNGGNNNGGGGGGRGGRGGAFNDPAVRDAMQKYMERPEVKAKMDQFQTASEKLQEQYTNALYRVLSKRQLAIYKKMLGAPFDLSKIRGGAPGRGPWNAPNRNAAVAKGQGTAPSTANATPKIATGKTSESAGETATTTDKPATDAAKTKRKNSLRAARGLDDD
jgi:hypothetical protein